MPTMIAAPGHLIPHRTKSSSALAVQSPPSHRVHFPISTSIVTGVSRPLTVDEAWYLYDFESHARKCHYCHNPYKRYKSGAGLCPHGDGLAQGVASMVYMYHGEVYERSSHRRKPSRVEVPHTYTFLFEQLRVMEEVSQLRYTSPAPVRPSENKKKVQIHVEPRQDRDTTRRSERTEVVIESARSGDRRDAKNRKEKYRHEPEYRPEREREREHHEHRRDYRTDEKQARSYIKTAEMEVSNSRDKRYRTENRRPVWVENN